MSELTDQQIVSDIARDLVSQAAPKELPLFPATSAAFFGSSGRGLRWQRPRDEMLGFGGGGKVTMLTPTALSIAAAVVHRLAEWGGGQNKVEAMRVAFRRYRAPDETRPPALTANQVASLRSEVLKLCAQQGLPDERANVIADALVQSLDGPQA